MSITATDFTYISTLVDKRSAIVLRQDKAYLVESRLAPLVRELGHGSIADLVTTMRRRPDRALESRVVEAMTTNETSWFRDRHPFDALREHVVPELLERNAATRSLRVWSAACSTGQELYSVAMVLDEHFPQLARWSVELLGTDLSTAVVQKAREGRYSALEVNRGLPAPLLVRYMERDGRTFRVSEALRRRARFEEQNLVGRWPARPPLDVVLIRNVLIYFDLDVRRQILARVHAALRPGGYLLLGASESTLGLVEGFRSVPAAGAVIYRKET